MPPPFVLTLPSDLAQLTSARAFLCAACQAAGFDSAATEALALAVHEALHNVIQHAHRLNASVMLEIRCHASAECVEVQILDEGDPFDLASVPHLDPAEMRIGGRGVFLMRQLTDELTCAPRGERGNILRLVKRAAPNSTNGTAG